jgi:CDP-paratose 2-epimerase
VRDNIHSADLIHAFYEFFKKPRVAEVYNIGGGRISNCSMIEAIEICQQITGKHVNWKYVEQNRQGDHIWWISDFSQFQSHYPNWSPTYDVPKILREIYELNWERWSETCSVPEKRMFSAF